MYNYKLLIQPVRKTYYKSATSDERVPGICKETRARVVNLVIVSKSQGQTVKQLTGRFCSDIIIVSGANGWVWGFTKISEPES